MSNDKKTNVTIALNNDQLDMLDFVLTILNHGMHSRTSYLLSNIRNDIKGYLGFNEEVSLPDDQLLDLAVKRNENIIKSLIGEENYNQLIDENKGDE